MDCFGITPFIIESKISFVSSKGYRKDLNDLLRQHGGRE
jgi:hypothetical protein